MANTALNRTGQFVGTNKSGGDLTQGAVVILDNTNNNGFTTTTSAALSTRGIAVIIEPNGIANNASGMVAAAGWVPKINLNASATAGQFVKTHTVAGQGTAHASPQVEGDFAVVLDVTSASSPTAWLFGSPNAPGTGGTSPGGSNTQVQYNNAGAFGGITGATTNGTALTLVSPVLGTPASGDATNLTNIPVNQAKSGAILPAANGGGLVFLASVTTASSATTVDFSSISASYKSLYVSWIAQNSGAGSSDVGMNLKINNDGTSGNYTSAGRTGVLNGSALNGNVAASSSGSQVGTLAQSGTSNSASAGDVIIPGYAQTTFHKRVIGKWGEDSTSAGILTATISFRWKSTSAINQLTFAASDGTAFTDGSFFALYGMQI